MFICLPSHYFSNGHSTGTGNLISEIEKLEIDLVFITKTSTVDSNIKVKIPLKKIK